MADAYCRFHVGDALTVMREMPDASVDLVLTSPPFLALRSYLPADHPDKAKEMGSEPTPGAYIDALLTIVEEARRVLAPHGSLAIELGDTFAGSGGAGGDYDLGGVRNGAPKFKGSALADRKNKVLREDGNRLQQGPAWPLDKSLSLIPESLRWAMAYGRNPFTGRETPRWRVRNVVQWVRPNPPVGALGDKFRPATTEMVVACMSRDRWFDLDAVRSGEQTKPGGGTTTGWGKSNDGSDRKAQIINTGSHPAGAPPLDWWQIPTEPYPGSHYATWPRDLCVIPIQAMCPRRVCVTCGEPSRRVVEASERYAARLSTHTWSSGGKERGHAKPASSVGWEDGSPVAAERRTVGWTTCNCHCQRCTSCLTYQYAPCNAKWRAGVVLDPFAGSGTTLAVAQGHGRSAIGIDLDPRNLGLARTRIGMFLEEAA